MNRTSLAAAVLAFAVAWPAAAATPLDTKRPRETVTVDFLLEACSVVGETAYGMIPHFDCESFLYGVLDTAAAAPQPLACVPAGTAPWQVYELLLAEDVADARRGEPAAAYVLERLRSAFPCG
jgi:hypothetical protein